MTVWESGASIASTFEYQSSRGLMRSLVCASGPPRTMSNVCFTSFDVKGLPSCHFTSLRRKNTRFRSCRQDHFSASSPMIVSALSVALRGSNSTRLLKQGIPGHTEEIVDVSWMAKPWGRSSRWVMARVPPGLGVWATASGTTASAIRVSRTGSRKLPMVPPHRAGRSASRLARCRTQRTPRKAPAPCARGPAGDRRGPGRHGSATPGSGERLRTPRSAGTTPEPAPRRAA